MQYAGLHTSLPLSKISTNGSACITGGLTYLTSGHAGKLANMNTHIGPRRHGPSLMLAAMCRTPISTTQLQGCNGDRRLQPKRTFETTSNKGVTSCAGTSKKFPRTSSRRLLVDKYTHTYHSKSPAVHLE